MKINRGRMDFEKLSRKKGNLISLTVCKAKAALQPVLPAMEERY